MRIRKSWPRNCERKASNEPRSICFDTLVQELAT